MDIYKFKTASVLRSYSDNYHKKKIKQEIGRVKDEITKLAKDGYDSGKIFFNEKSTAEEVYKKITPELIYNGYTVSYLVTKGIMNEPMYTIRISWKHGGFGPYQIEEHMQDYYKTIGEMREG